MSYVWLYPQGLADAQDITGAQSLPAKRVFFSSKEFFGNLRGSRSVLWEHLSCQAQNFGLVAWNNSAWLPDSAPGSLHCSLIPSPCLLCTLLVSPDPRPCPALVSTFLWDWHSVSTKAWLLGPSYLGRFPHATCGPPVLGSPSHDPPPTTCCWSLQYQANTDQTGIRLLGLASFTAACLASGCESAVFAMAR